MRKKEVTVFHRIRPVPWVLIATLLFCSALSSGAFSQNKKIDAFRLPSEVLANVQTMRNTDFMDKHKYVNVEEDVQQYLRYELQRMKAASATFTGKELYALGLVYKEAQDLDQTIQTMESFVNENSGATLKDLRVKGRKVLIEVLIKKDRCTEASGHLASLDEMEEPLLELLFMELAKGYAQDKDAKKALNAARKALSRMDPNFSGFFLDHILTHFLRAGLREQSLMLIDEILTSKKDDLDKESKTFLMNRKNQVSLIGKPAPSFENASFRWLGTSSPPTAQRLSQKVMVIYFWASWCDPCLSFMVILDEFQKIHGKEGLEILGVTRLYGRGKLPDEPLKRNMKPEDEWKLLSALYEKTGVRFPAMIDQENALHRAMLAKEVPHLAVIDRNGLVRLFISGGNIETDLLDGMIKELLDEEPNTHD